jgi:biopolymer transport protein ExbD
MKAIPEIEPEASDMTPMIDIVFQLLIFFMLTMHFQEVEGKMLSQLPKHGPGPGTAPPREEIRFTVRADRLFVEKHEIGELGSTEKEPGRKTSNKAAYAAAAGKARGLIDLLGPERAAVILDADGATAYEHVIGLIDACKAERINDIEFVGNPKLTRYYQR